jgi:hypothetical protein
MNEQRVVYLLQYLSLLNSSEGTLDRAESNARSIKVANEIEKELEIKE